MLAVFPHVETWMTQGSDLLFVARLDPPSYPIERLAERLEHPLFQEALARAWLGRTVDDFAARHFAGTSTARRIAEGAKAVNSDDRNVLEYGLARTQLGQAGFFYQDLLVAAVADGDDQPRHLRAGLDQARLMEARFHLFATESEIKDTPAGLSEERAQRAKAILAWADSRYEEVLSQWRGPVVSPAEQLMMAVSVGRVGTTAQAKPILAAIERNWPVDAWVAASWLAYRQGAHAQAVTHLGEAFRAMEVHPWAHSRTLDSVVELSALLVAAQPQEAERLIGIWMTPLSVGQLAPSAPTAWYRLGLRLPVERRLEVLSAIGPDHPWNREFLRFKKETLEAAGHTLAAEARREWERLVREEGRGLSEVLPPRSAGTGGGPR